MTRAERTLALLLVAVAIIAATALTLLGRRDVTADRLQAEIDSLSARAVRVDTVYQRDTVRLWRSMAAYDTVRLRDTLVRNDTVFVPRAVADAVVADCRATVLTCEQRVAVRDSLIAKRDTQVAVFRREAAHEKRAAMVRSAGLAIVGWEVLKLLVRGR